MKQIDVLVENHGSLFLLQPLTASASDWLGAHTGDEAQWFGSALVVEPRYVRDIVDGAQGDGLVVA